MNTKKTGSNQQIKDSGKKIVQPKESMLEKALILSDDEIVAAAIRDILKRDEFHKFH